MTVGEQEAAAASRAADNLARAERAEVHAAAAAVKVADGEVALAAAAGEVAALNDTARAAGQPAATDHRHTRSNFRESVEAVSSRALRLAE